VRVVDNGVRPSGLLGLSRAFQRQTRQIKVFQIGKNGGMNQEELTSFIQCSNPFFEKVKEANLLPYMWRFPEGCCEVASGIVGVALERLYPTATVHVVKGTAKDVYRMHFWVEINEWVVDVTSHQFPHIETPILCSVPNPLERKFPDTERMSSASAVEALKEVRCSPELISGLADRLLEDVRNGT
ncbi:hypothetical protein, partial [Comamonas sp.]|uniref:hypothetical protein n=1 Tax=Comamonas sp. TaxID=34028 RepID=UPI00289C2FFF